MKKKVAFLRDGMQISAVSVTRAYHVENHAGLSMQEAAEAAGGRGAAPRRTRHACPPYNATIPHVTPPTCQ